MATGRILVPLHTVINDTFVGLSGTVAGTSASALVPFMPG